MRTINLKLQSHIQPRPQSEKAKHINKLVNIFAPPPHPTSRPRAVVLRSNVLSVVVNRKAQKPR